MGKGPMTNIAGIDRVVLFGDSITDADNLTKLVEPVIDSPIPLADPNSGYVGGRFTNGLIYGEYLANYLGKEVENYAIGGGQTLGDQSLLDRILFMGWRDLINVPLDDPRLQVDLNFDTQIANFLADNPGDLSTTAASVLMGANDLYYADIQSVDTFIQDGAAFVVDVAQAAFDEMQKLVDAGVGMIIVNTIPLGPISPINSETNPDLQLIVETGISFYNTLVRLFADSLEGTKTEIVLIDLAVIGEELAADLTTFGFTAGENESVIDNYHFEPYEPNPDVAGYDDDQVVFFDYVHLTTAMHGVFGIFQAKNLTHEVEILNGFRNFHRGEDTNDLVIARGGNDFIMSSGGHDVVLLGLGNDTSYLGRGNDFAMGGSGNDAIFGGTGDDVLGGNAGNDRLIAGSGNDLIVDGLGSDNARGGSGNDVFYWVEDDLVQTETDDRDSFNGGFGNDTLVLALTQESADAFAETSSSEGVDDALADLGISIRSVETVEVAVGRHEGVELLGLFATDTQVNDADLWGLI